MATLLNLHTSEKVQLLALHTFGRKSGSSNTLLYNSEASRLHAVIMWDGKNWFLKDSSANGSYLNGRHCQTAAKVALEKGDTLQFGSLQGEVWQVDCVAAPQSMLLPLDVNSKAGKEAITLVDIAALPSEQSPEVTLFLSPKGAWVCETQEGISVLEEGDLVKTSEGCWHFVDARPNAETVELSVTGENSSPVPEFFFEVSQNEEHVDLSFSCDQQYYKLGQRSHHYLLLLLARERLKHQEQGIKEEDQGWIDKGLLRRMTGLNEYHMNMQVHRLRKQFIQALPPTQIMAPLVERRRGELRFSFGHFHLHGGFERQA